MKKVRNILSEKYPEMLTYGCNAHFVNLLEQAVSPKQVLSHIAEIQKFFRNNHRAHGLLQQLNGLMPQLPNETRWNSQNACLDTFLKNYYKYQQIAEDEDLQMETGLLTKLKNVALYKEAQNLQKQLHFVSLELEKDV